MLSACRHTVKLVELNDAILPAFVKSMVLHFKVDGYRKRVKAHGTRHIPPGSLHQPPGRRLCLLGQTFPQKKGKKPFGSPSLCSFHWLRRSSLVNSWT